MQDFTITQIDRYRISHELGRGGMAVVYFAHDPRIGREVAIKVMLGSLLNDHIYRRRFNTEVKAIAALEHPNIVPIYDYGLYEKQPYLVMRYMAGGSLVARLKEAPLSVSETATVIRRIGLALGEAHNRGIIHRDLKPANILLDQYGMAFLSDFGVVKTRDSRVTPTDEQLLAGTPAYMSPEQIQGERQLDGRSDIYALGAMLFELLTGQKPFDGDAPMTIVYKHLSEPVPSLLQYNPNLPEPIDTIITRAMAKKPQDRYPTVGEMVQDLLVASGQTLTGTEISPPEAIPVTIRPGGRPSRVSGRLRTLFDALRRIPVWGWALGVVIVVGWSLFAILTTRGSSGSFIASPLVTPDPAVVAAGRGGGTIAFVSEIAGAPDIYLLEVDGAGVRRVLNDVTSKSDPAWSPDGKQIVFRSQVKDQHVIDVMNADGTNVRQLFGEAAENFTPDWSPDGKKIVFASKRDGNPEIYAMNTDGSGIVRLTNNPAADWKPTWSPDGQFIAFYSGRDGNFNIYVMNADGGNPIVLTGSPAGDYDPAWSPDGKKIAFVSERDGNAEIYVMDADGTDQVRLTRNDAADISPTWSPDGKNIAFVSKRDGNAEIYVMDVDGTDQRRLTNSPEDNLNPVWQPR